MRERYCAYGRHYKPDNGFKLVKHPQSGTQRAMCPSCQATRERPQTELQALADQEKQARKASRK